MNFDLNGFFKFFGSIYKIAFILFLCGLFLTLSNKELLAKFYLMGFINQYGVYIGIVTLISGVITILYVIETVFDWLKKKYQLSKNTDEIIVILKDLSIDEKKVLAYFLANKTQTSNLGIEYQRLDEPMPIGMLMAKSFLHKGSVGINPYYQVDSTIWDILQKNWQKILYEEEFHTKG